MRTRRAFGTLVLILLGFLAACGDDDDGEDTTEDSQPGSLEGDLTVFAAASLTDAFNEIGGILEQEHEDLGVEFNFASSNALLSQIQEGAPADVYASAATAPMDTATDEGLVEDSEIFARNVPVVVVPADNPAGIEEVGDLANDGVSLVLAAEDVPIGTYSREVIANLAADEEYGPEFEQAVLDNVVSNEADVRAVLTKVELGEADAGIVYVTDALISGDAVMTIEIPEEFNVIADYPVAAILESDDEEVAQAFIDFLLSEEGQAILSEYGFRPVD